MSNDSEIKELLRQGVEAARAGDRATARGFFEQVTEQDENNERGWFWLATVVDTDEERRICLTNVLRINPDNEKARQALEKLDAKQRAVVAEQEVIPGISRRQLTLLLGAAAAVIGILFLIFLLITVNNNNAAGAQRATQTSVALATAQQSINETSTALFFQPTFAVETATASVLIVPSATPTVERATLPPLPTASPTATEVGVMPTLPPPVGLTGSILGWSGRDVSRVGFLQVAFFPLASPGAVQVVSELDARFPTLYPGGDRIVFTRFFRSTSDFGLMSMTTAGTQEQALSDRWRATDFLVGVDHATYSPNGAQLVFSAFNSDSGKREIYLLNMTEVPSAVTPDPAAPAVSPLVLLTNGDAQYDYPSFSPDASRVVVVRDTAPNLDQVVDPDVVIIDIATRTQRQITSDAGGFIETYPRFSPDGQTIIYNRALGTSPDDHDIVVTRADGSGVQTAIVGLPGVDERYPTYSPDGRYIAYAANPARQYDIFIFDQQTSATFQLTANSREDDYPTVWLP